MTRFTSPSFVIGSVLVLSLLIGTILFFNAASFGKYPTGDRLKRIQSSANYKNGQFQNVEHTPNFKEGETYFSVLWHFLFEKDKNVIPKIQLPTQKTDLIHLNPKENVLVWFGHSSYFLQIDGKKILVDPVFCGYAGPYSFMVNAFKGTDVYTVDDLPQIDYLFLTHDHYDHVDSTTLSKLNDKVGKVITGLGVGESLTYWGLNPNKIIENDWNESVDLGNGFQTTFVTARHFSGRGFQRNLTLWGSFVVTTSTGKYFFGGDSGYGKHFKEIGEKFGPFDLVFLENGQYNLMWKYIHLLPEEALIAAQDLKAKRLFPVHNSKFVLASHAWNAPMTELSRLNEKYQIPLVTPVIGQKVDLDNKNQKFFPWWNLD